MFGIQEVIAHNYNSINGIIEGKVTALASYIWQVAKEAHETTKESKATDTGDDQGRREKRNRKVYPLRALIFCSS